jgi:hypothetical protein
MHAASKAAVGATFAKATPNKPLAKAKKAAADKRKTATATTSAAPTGTKPGDGAKLPSKK